MVAGLTLAIDPGDEQTGFVIFDGEKPTLFGKWDNRTLLREIEVGASFATARCAIETLKPRGMPTSFEEMQAQLWAGRFYQAWYHRHGGDKFGVNEPAQVFRQDVKMHLCGQMKARDSNIRAALIDRFGGESKAIGGKKCHACKGQGWRGRARDICDYCGGNGWQHPPGPLKGITADCWSALAIAITHHDQLTPAIAAG